MTKKIISIFKKNWIYILFYSIFAIILLANTFHEKYPDEFDNILGGWLLTRGKFLYRDFFTHHNPLAYLVAGLITFFTKQSFVRFRVGLAVFWLFVSIISHILFFRKKNKKIQTYYLIYLGIYAISATYYWTHMLLADSLATFFYIPGFLLIIYNLLNKKNLSAKDLIVINLYNVFVFLSSATFSYLLVATNLLALFLYIRQYYNKNDKAWIKNLFNLKHFLLLIILMIPYCLFLLSLLTTNSLSSYYTDTVEFNLKYYIYNYPKPFGSMRINPIRYILIIFDKVLNDYWVLAQLFKDFNLSNPINIALAFGNIIFIVYATINKKIKLAMFILVNAILSNFRGNPLGSQQTDYQSALYIYSSAILLIILLPLLRNEAIKKKNYLTQLTWCVIFLSMAIYSVASLAVFSLSFEKKFFAKYMGNEPLIYDYVEIAPVMNKVLTSHDYVWIGPFHFEEMFYQTAQPASKFTILLPEFIHIQKYQDKLVNDLQKNQPKIIFLDQRYFVRGASPETSGPFLIKYIKKNYTNLTNFTKLEPFFRPIPEKDYAFNMDIHWWLRKDVDEELFNKIKNAI